MRKPMLSLLVALLFLWEAGPAAAATPAPAFGRDGMVVTSQIDATVAGHTMLAMGGNAIDAAVASAFAVGVTQPFSTGIGGGGFILIHLADDEGGDVIAIDARETAPAAASRDMYVEPGVASDASLRGGLAVATPGLVAGLVQVQEEYGRLPLAVVMEPAIRLARDGFAIGPYNARLMGFMRSRLPADDPRFAETVRIQFPPEGVPALPGWQLVQEDLGRTLQAIAKGGAAAFYSGPIAKAIADAAVAAGGVLTEADVVGYEVRTRTASAGSYRGLEVFSFPPPSSGGVALIEMLNVLEGFDLSERPLGSSASIHVIAEAMKLAFADRAVHLGDPDFVDVPVARLTSKEYAKTLRTRINPPWFRRAPWHWGRREQAIRVKAPGLRHDDSGTTHLSTSDAWGNAVAITKTINTPYGSGVTVPGTGILLNNEMDDFSKKPLEPNAYGLIDTRGANAIAPGKRPLSSMTPTILRKDGRLFMVTGSPGGPRIISTTLLTILGVVDYGLDVKAAVSAPRFHHPWVPDVLSVEPSIAQDVVEALRARGHAVKPGRREWSAAEAIVVDSETGWHYGGNDPRRDGLALGFSVSRGNR
jgi:gamma-glutamyltranspeptidase/glutathione hydrolase